MTAVRGPGELFRLDNEYLAFRFTATLSDRYGVSYERLTGPARLAEWLRLNGLDCSETEATPRDLDLARRLREAVHRAGAAVARRERIAAEDLELINRIARSGQARRQLHHDGAHWATTGPHPIRDALGVIASEAIETLGGADRDRVKTCDNPDCRGLYVDTSRGRNRRWCSMNTCGNKAKKAAMGARAATVG
ncbi:CGNR zinc finger domain-containing protein [Nonomuraea sp. NPDC000554]|uniref:CGNR zinc finger domain-containing protein n=1 Tax=Nonomuraea sp. NPDC000554 TaxID=3154259 RepID=UPI00331F6654